MSCEHCQHLPCNNCLRLEKTHRELIDLMEREKAQLVLTQLRTCNRGLLDRMREMDPQTIDFIVDHFNNRKKENQDV